METVSLTLPKEDGNLGFEWLIRGSSRVTTTGTPRCRISYRKPGEAAWSPALPLLCLQRERVFVGPQFDVVAPNMFAGSIPDLEPDTDYEARFVMTDPEDPDVAVVGRAPGHRAGSGSAIITSKRSIDVPDSKVPSLKS